MRAMINPSHPHRLLAYGSLRLHSARGHNFDRFGVGTQRYIRDVTLSGYTMYPVAGGAFPCVIEGIGTIKAELHEVSEGAFRAIRAMELDSGYTAKVLTLDDGTRATLYHVYPEQLPKGLKRVESGDWA